MNKYKCWKIYKKNQTPLQKLLKQKYYNKDLQNSVLQIVLSSILFMILEFSKYWTINIFYLNILKNTIIGLLQIFIPIYIVEVLRLLGIYRNYYYTYKGTIDSLYNELVLINRNDIVSCKNIIKKLKNYDKSQISLAFCINSTYGMNAYNCFVNRLYNFISSKYELCLAFKDNESPQKRKEIYKEVEKNYNYIMNCELCRIEAILVIIKSEFDSSFELIEKKYKPIQR